MRSEWDLMLHNVSLFTLEISDFCPWRLFPDVQTFVSWFFEIDWPLTDKPWQWFYYRWSRRCSEAIIPSSCGQPCRNQRRCRQRTLGFYQSRRQNVCFWIQRQWSMWNRINNSSEASGCRQGTRTSESVPRLVKTLLSRWIVLAFYRA